MALEQSDLLLVVLLIIVSIISTSISMVILQGKARGLKSKTKDSDEAFKEYKEIVAQMVTDLKTENKSLKGKVSKLTGLYGDESEDGTEEPDEVDAIIPLLSQKLNIPKELLQSDDIRAGLKRLLKDKTVKTFLPLLAKGSNNPLAPNTGQAGSQNFNWV